MKKRKIVTLGDYIYYVRAKMLYHNKTLPFITINSRESELRYSPTKAVGVRCCVTYAWCRKLCVPDAGERALEIYYTLDRN